MIVRATLSGALAACCLLTPAAMAEDAKSSASPSEEVSALEAAAHPYVMLREDIAKIEADGIPNAKALRTAHNRLSSHGHEDISRGIIAYAALVAADVPSFANAIEARTRRKKDRAAFLKELETNPAIVRDIKGADEAIGAIMDMLARDATRIAAVGDVYITEAYSLQKQAWARKKIASSGESRINSASKWAANRPWPAMAPRSAIRSKAGNVRPNLGADDSWSVTWSTDTKPPRADSKSGILMSQALVLAALYAVDDVEESDLREYARSKPTDRCLSNARLTLNACIAVARTPYEEAFCLGKHGLNDVSRCVGWPASAGATD